MKYYHSARRFLRQLSSYNVPLYAANASFYIILAFFPAVMLTVSLLPFFGFSSDDLLSAIGAIVPEIVMPLMQRIVSDVSSNSTGALLSASALVAIWSSSRGVYCIQLGLNAINGVRESRSYLHRRLLSVIYMIFVIAALILTLVLHGFGQELAAFFAKQNIPILQLLSDIMQFRGLILLVLLTALFTAMLTVFPNCKVSVRWALPGAALAALGWLVFTQCYSLYMRVSGSYSVLYGSLSIIAIGMLWLYVCISILFYGSVFTLLLERKTLER